MPEPAAPIEIPNRVLFKAAEVCELLKLQPYVLRSWEAEFPDLGVARTAGAPRLYRRGDIERVLRIRHLLLIEGLTLAGARRRIDEEAPPVASDDPEIDASLGQDTRERLAEVKRGLRFLLNLLGEEAGGSEFRLAARGAPVSNVRRPPAVPQGPTRLGSPARRAASPSPLPLDASVRRKI